METAEQIIEDPHKKIKDYSENVEVGDMHADICYLLILPFDSHASFDPKNYEEVPVIVTYKDEDTKVKEIIESYKNINPDFQDKHIELTFRGGRVLSSHQTMRDVAKQLKRDSINGVCLCININEEEDSDDNALYIDESNLTSYLANQYESGSIKMFELMI